MPVPEYKEITVPALNFFANGDGKLHKVSEVYGVLAQHFNLTEEEQYELLPSGRQRLWCYRANWACYDLYRAGLLDRPKRGLYQITETGKQLATQKPLLIDRNFLMRIPKFVQSVQTFGARKSTTDTGKTRNEKGGKQ